ncbi:MAG: BlaI/MecI/CopY family transcriptional regulator [Hamadaea sp.]|nr:BlaI/MecI/CopY family transcriptional regulator [Hamadaea sp.]
MRVFGDLEAVIMDLMWDRGEPATVRQIHDRLSPARPLAYTTVMTVMDNLHTKGHLTREMAGRAWRYEPAMSREEHTAQLMRDALAAADDQTAALSHFVAGLGEAQSQALRWLLRRRPHSGGPR